MVIEGNYSDIFGDTIPKETVTAVMNISKFREDFLNQRKIR